KCNLLSTSQMDEITEMYRSTDTFRNAKWVNGAKSIGKYNIPGKCKVTINSNSFSKDIADLKRKMILKDIKGINEEDLVLKVRDFDKKGIIEDATIVVDDSVENLRKYGDNVIKILIDKPFNQGLAYGIKHSEHIIRLGSLRQTMKFIDHILLDKFGIDVKEK
ncbi:MAG: hypothetical protein IJ593_11035, partial [Lachnospiraceae bacterium]|nr:hypothetical protein [Lachnospiraceae bacterium]